MKRYVLSHEINSHTKRYDNPAHVTLIRLGGATLSLMTPDEARALAAALIAAANEAEKA